MHQRPPVRHTVSDDVQETSNGGAYEESKDAKNSDDDWLDPVMATDGLAGADVEVAISQHKLWQHIFYRESFSVEVGSWPL